MALCDEPLPIGHGHVWGAWEAGGIIPKGELCSCWSMQPDGKLGHTPIPRDVKVADGEWMVTESDLGS